MVISPIRQRPCKSGPKAYVCSRTAPDGIRQLPPRQIAWVSRGCAPRLRDHDVGLFIFDKRYEVSSEMVTAFDDDDFHLLRMHANETKQFTVLRSD
ncbi:hypothetical protein C7399_13186, partial [Paraburkholderia tropica]